MTESALMAESMNRLRAKELLPIIEAFARGEDVQFKRSLEWLKNDPSFHDMTVND